MSFATYYTFQNVNNLAPSVIYIFPLAPKSCVNYKIVISNGVMAQKLRDCLQAARLGVRIPVVESNFLFSTLVQTSLEAHPSFLRGSKATGTVR